MVAVRVGEVRSPGVSFVARERILPAMTSIVEFQDQAEAVQRRLDELKEGL